VAVLDQFVGFGQWIAHVDHVEMPDIRAEDRVELRPEGIAAAERCCIHAVVCLAAEIIGLGVEIDPVFLARDLAGREIVDILDPARQIGLFGVGQAATLAQGGGMSLYPYFSTRLSNLARSSLSGCMRSNALALRRSQCSIRSPNNWPAQPTSPSRNAKRNSGERG
jgi:hypothetical protein